MKKKSLSAKKIIHKNLLKNLNDPRIKKIYSILKENLKNIKYTNNIGVAVSGGPDSLALSYLLKCFSLQSKVKIFYYMVNHGLRANSSKESKLVKVLLKKSDMECKILNWKGIKPKSNLQSKARNKRYSLIFKQCLKDKVKILFTAHHQDDLYENFFIRILRGSGLEGFVSFNSINNSFNRNLNIVRPLIDIKKSELIYISNKVFNFYIEDPSNNNLFFKRAKLRKLIDELKSEGLDFNKLKLTINNLSDSNRTINYYVNKNINNNSKFLKNKSAYILNNKFFKNPNEIIFRSFSRILREVGKKYYSARGKSILRLIRSIDRSDFKKMTLSGCIIEKIDNSVVIYKEFGKIS